MANAQYRRDYLLRLSRIPVVDIQIAYAEAARLRTAALLDDYVTADDAARAAAETIAAESASPYLIPMASCVRATS